MVVRACAVHRVAARLVSGFNSETGLYFDRARYLDPTTGRFLSEDPIGVDGGINLYRYALNGPVTTADPFGLCPQEPSNKKQPGCDAVMPADPTTARLAQLVFSEGNGTTVGDLAIASVVVNRANYGNPAEFGTGILGVINKGFQGTSTPQFEAVAHQAQISNLDPANCLRYKNSALAAIAAQKPDGTNTDAEFYYDTSAPTMPKYLRDGIRNKIIISAPVDGGSNVLSGLYGGTQYFYQYKDYSH